MTELAIKRGLDLEDAFVPSCWYKEEPRAKGVLKHFRDYLEQQQVTAQVQLRVTSPASEWLSTVWSRGRGENREAVWEYLAEHVGEALDEGAELQAGDIAFLAGVIRGSSDSFEEVAAAIRTLAVLGEEQIQWRESVLPALKPALASESVSIKIVAAEAFWQIAEPNWSGVLEQALADEDHEQVKATIRRALESSG